MKKFFFPSLLICLFIIDLCAQCFPDRHNTSFQSVWQSCEKQENPNPSRESSHWIMYDLGYHYLLGESKIWNYNDPEHLEKGIRTLAIDYSTDGATWTHFTDFDLQMASGKSIYEGIAGPDFAAITTRYLLLTVLENWGDPSCSGFGELRIQLAGSTTVTDEIKAYEALHIYPNPFRQFLHVKLEQTAERLNYELQDMLGKIIKKESIASVSLFTLDGQGLTTGHYILTVKTPNKIFKNKVIYIGE